MADATDLPSAVRIVRAGIGEAERASGPYPGSDAFAWQDRRREAMTALGESLARQLDARITVRWDSARVRICGISSSSTCGLAGALQNWLVAAEHRLRRTREGKA